MCLKNPKILELFRRIGWIENRKNTLLKFYKHGLTTSGNSNGKNKKNNDKLGTEDHLFKKLEPKGILLKRVKFRVIS